MKENKKRIERSEGRIEKWVSFDCVSLVSTFVATALRVLDANFSLFSLSPFTISHSLPPCLRVRMHWRLLKKVRTDKNVDISRFLSASISIFSCIVAWHPASAVWVEGKGWVCGGEWRGYDSEWMMMMWRWFLILLQCDDARSSKNLSANFLSCRVAVMTWCGIGSGWWRWAGL
jgi:hypothetical protein